MGIHELEAAIANHKPDAIAKMEYNLKYRNILHKLIAGGSCDMVEAASKMKNLPEDLRNLAAKRLDALKAHSHRGPFNYRGKHPGAGAVPLILRHL